MEYLEKLNEDQRKVVLNNDGPMAVISGAGSGKTTTIVSKMTYLIDEKKVRPARIVACTLTNKAAEEIRERMIKVIGEEKASKVRMSTIHSFAYKTYKEAKKFYNSNFKPSGILFNQWVVIKPLLNKAIKNKLGNKQVKDHLQIIGSQKIQMIDRAQYKKLIEFDRKLKDCQGDLSRLPFECCVYMTWVEYDKYLSDNDKMDFADILVNCYKTIANPKYDDFLQDYTSKIEYLIVDEAQDTTELSFKIIDCIRKYNKNICIVGDLRQTIFSFAGAYIQNIPNFVKRYNPEIVDLQTNYRSTQTIVNNANHFISTAKMVMGKPSNTPNPIGNKIKFMTSGDDREESDQVVNLVQQLLDGGENPNEIAIIYRVNSQAIQVEDALTLYGIDYISYSDQAFYQRKETKDLLTYLKIMLDPSEATAEEVKRVINRPLRYVKNEIIDEIFDAAFENDSNFLDIATEIHYPSQFQENAIYKFICDIREGHRMINEGKPPLEVVDFILKDMGYEAWASAEKKVEDMEADVTMNLDAVMTSSGRFTSVKDFLKHIALLVKKEKKKKEEDGDFIRLMTIHRAKGKEFKHVFIIGMCDRCYPFYKARGDSYQEEEEKRIMYVAITRPKTDLYLSVINGKLGSFDVRPSRYLADMQIEYQGGTNLFL